MLLRQKTNAVARNECGTQFKSNGVRAADTNATHRQMKKRDKIKSDVHALKIHCVGHTVANKCQHSSLCK